MLASATFLVNHGHLNSTSSSVAFGQKGGDAITLIAAYIIAGLSAVLVAQRFAADGRSFLPFLTRSDFHSRLY